MLRYHVPVVESCINPAGSTFDKCVCDQVLFRIPPSPVTISRHFKMPLAKMSEHEHEIYRYKSFALNVLCISETHCESIMICPVFFMARHVDSVEKNIKKKYDLESCAAENTPRRQRTHVTCTRRERSSLTQIVCIDILLLYPPRPPRVLDDSTPYVFVEHTCVISLNFDRKKYRF